MTPISSTGALCLWKVPAEYSEPAFYPAWAGDKESVSTCGGTLTRNFWFPEEPGGWSLLKFSLGTFVYLVFFILRIASFSMRKKSYLSRWPWDWNPGYLAILLYVARSLGVPRQAWVPFPRFCFPLSPQFANNKTEGHLLKVSPVKAGGAQSHPRPLPSWWVCWI